MIETIQQKLKRLQDYDNELSKVMSPDFKDWWENSKTEWPSVARMVIEGLRKERDFCYDIIDKQAIEIKELDCNIEALICENAGEDW